MGVTSNNSSRLSPSIGKDSSWRYGSDFMQVPAKKARPARRASKKMPRLCRLDRHPGTEGSRWSPSAKFWDRQLRRSHPLVNPATYMPKHWFKECMVKSRTLQGQTVGRHSVAAPEKS